MSDLFGGYIITVPTIGTISTGIGTLVIEDQDGLEENVAVRETNGTESGNSKTQVAVDEWNSMTYDEILARIADPNWPGNMNYYNNSEECINAYREYWFSNKGIDISKIAAATKSGADFIKGTNPSNTNVADLFLGRVNVIRSSLSPWGVLSENVAIDMGPVRGVSTDLLTYMHMTGILIGMVLILSAIIGYIIAQEGQLKARYKSSAMYRILVTCVITGALILLSVLMDICNLIFLV